MLQTNPFIVSIHILWFVWLLTDISDLLVCNRQRRFGSCEIAKKRIQKALAAKTTSMG